MKKTTLVAIIRVTGILIMLFAFVIIPDDYPWFYAVLLFDIGLLLCLATKWNKFKGELKRVFRAT